MQEEARRFAMPALAVASAVGLVIAILALALLFTTRSSLSGTKSDLAATRGQLTVASDRLQALEGNFTDAQAVLATAQAALQATLKELTDEQRTLEGTLTSAQAVLTGAQADIATLTAEAGTLKSSLASLNSGFLIAQEDVGKNKDALAALKTASDKAGADSRYAMVAHAYLLWWSVPTAEADVAAGELLGQTAAATGDTRLRELVGDFLVAWGTQSEQRFDTDEALLLRILEKLTGTLTP